MKLHRILEKLSEPADQGSIPRSIIDEGRIFALGAFENEDFLHGRVKDVVEGLKAHVGQPFELHAWAFVLSLSTLQQDGLGTPMTLGGVVQPQSDGAVIVTEFILLPRGLRPTNRYIFGHTENGTVVTVLGAPRSEVDAEDRAAASLYPLAAAILNTRGCSIEFKRAPGVANARRRRQGKHIVPAHYDIDAAEYISALRSSAESTLRGGTHASPIPHLRRAHERVLSSGERIWIPSALVNVRKERDIAFVERRKAYQRNATRRLQE